MRFVGIDLAGNPRNPTGFCVLEVREEGKYVRTRLLFEDREIVREVVATRPKVVAIDAPLTNPGRPRRCDEELRKYGALPLTLRGMEKLAERGKTLAGVLRGEGLEVIEVFPTATAKLLGYYSKDELEVQRMLLSAKLRGDIEKRVMRKDELDAIFAAITAYLHFHNMTESVGDEEGVIVVPRV